MNLYLEHTPIEEHNVRGRLVYVKREDLYGQYPAPPLGKLRGMRAVVRTLYNDGVRLIGCWDTRVSRLGEGLAALASEFDGLRTIVGYPVKALESVPFQITAAKQLGSTIMPLRGNVTPICFAQAKRRVERLGGTMLPFGLECEAAVAAVAIEATLTPVSLLENGTLVLCVGSGVTLAGLLRGLPVLPERIIALSSGRSLRTIRSCLQRHVGPLPRQLSLIEALMPYYASPRIAAPFPCHPNYDLKAWMLLTRCLKNLESPVLFWNIGA
jgi:hypothetical protein